MRQGWRRKPGREALCAEAEEFYDHLRDGSRTRDVMDLVGLLQHGPWRAVGQRSQTTGADRSWLNFARTTCGRSPPGRRRCLRPTTLGRLPPRVGDRLASGGCRSTRVRTDPLPRAGRLPPPLRRRPASVHVGHRHAAIRTRARASSCNPHSTVALGVARRSKRAGTTMGTEPIRQFLP